MWCGARSGKMSLCGNIMKLGVIVGNYIILTERPVIQCYFNIE